MSMPKLILGCQGRPSKGLTRFIVKYIQENIENFNTRLISRGYPEQMVEKTLRKVKY